MNTTRSVDVPLYITEMSNPPQQRYPLAVHSWKTSAGPIIIRCLHSGIIIGTFPLEFVALSGRNSWNYILFVISHLVVAAELHTSLLRDSEGIDMDPQCTVHAGDFTYEQIGEH
jgi:hypothetical protein